jgi:hypothetical protein
MRIRDKGWALAYLRGRVRGYRQSNLTGRHVEGAIEIASRCGATLTEIRDALAPHSMDWDPATGKISRAHE